MTNQIGGALYLSLGFARDDKVPGPQLGAKQLPGERPPESAET